MAQAFTATVKPNLTEAGHKTIIVRGTGVLSGTYAAGGPTWDLTCFAGVPVKKDAAVLVRIWGTGVADHSYGYVPGTNLTDGKVVATVTSTGAELADGAVPAAITADTISFEVILPKH